MNLKMDTYKEPKSVFANPVSQIPVMSHILVLVFFHISARLQSRSERLLENELSDIKAPMEFANLRTEMLIQEISQLVTS